MDRAVVIQEFLIDQRRGVRREIGVCLVLVPFFAYQAIKIRALTMMSCRFGLLAASAAVEIALMWFVVRTRANLLIHPADDVTFWRAEILRQARLRWRVLLWYLGPSVPGFVCAFWPLSDLPWRFNLIFCSTLWAFVLGIFALVIRLNRKAARELEQTAASLG